MRASAPRALHLAAALGAAWVTRTRRPAPRGTTAALGTPDIVQEMARQAPLLDAQGDRAADTLPTDQCRAQPSRGRSRHLRVRAEAEGLEDRPSALQPGAAVGPLGVRRAALDHLADLVRSEEQRLNSSHSQISYAVFCLKQKHR